MTTVKLLFLLVFVSAIATADAPLNSQNGRYTVSNDVVLDTRTGKAWQATSGIQGLGSLKVLLPLSYFEVGKGDVAATDKSLADFIRNGIIKLNPEPPK